MNVNPRAVFFDEIAEKWDGWEDQGALRARLADGLRELAVASGESVLDVGCGTGNLTGALLERLGPAGRVVAVDLSARMIEVARAKLADPRVDWRRGDVRELGLPDATIDRVMCYSVWPHFDDPAGVAAELRRVLRPGGLLHVWHLLPRAKINEIHAGAGPAVRHDVLPPAAELARLLAGLGFAVGATVDDDRRYLVTAARAST